MDWISVEKRLPQAGAYALVAWNDEYPRSAQGWILMSTQEQVLASVQLGSINSPLRVNVTHWMPMPKPPKDNGPFITGESSMWPHPEGALYGVRHKTLGWVCDFRGHIAAQQVRDRLNKIWTSDKGEENE